jgi:hypothetical protein
MVGEIAQVLAGGRFNTGVCGGVSGLYRPDITKPAPMLARAPRWARLVNPRAFVPHLDCCAFSNVVNDPTRFKHNPSHGQYGGRGCTLRDLYAINKHEEVLAVIVKLQCGFVAHLTSIRPAGKC